MSVRRLSKTFISGAGAAAEKSSNFLAGYSPAIDEMDLIERITVGAGGTSAIEFDQIPQTYQHLQVRWIGQSNRATYATDNLWVRLNGDTGSNYTYHKLRGDGASVLAVGYANQTKQYFSGVIGTTQQPNSFGAGVIDILDYASTSKTTTVRILAGKDNNGTYAGYGGYVEIASGLYFATPAAVSTFTLIAENGDWQQYSTASLYGVKA